MTAVSGCSKSNPDNTLVRIEENADNRDSLRAIAEQFRELKNGKKRRQLVAQAQQLPDSTRAVVLAVCATPKEAAQQMYDEPSLSVIRQLRDQYALLGYTEKAAQFERDMDSIFKTKTPEEQARFLTKIFTPAEIRRGLEERDSALRIELNIR